MALLGLALALALLAAPPARAQGIAYPPIQAAETRTAAFVGVFPSGPSQQPVEVSSYLEFEAVFETSPSAGEGTRQVAQYFLNGGTSAWIVRVGPEPLADPATLIGDAAARTGVFALEKAGPFEQLVLPDLRALPEGDYASVLQNVLPWIAQKRAFLVLDVPAGRTTPSAAIAWASANPLIRSDFAAAYFPALIVSGSALGSAGTAAGVYARVDSQNGVWRSPAGSLGTVLGASALAYAVTSGDSSDLATAGVNPLRSLGTIQLYGARTFLPASTPTEFRYVPGRRLDNMIARSVAAGAVFARAHPNGDPIRLALRAQAEDFLLGLWRAGALQGVSPSQAFFVRCDATTELAPRAPGILFGYALLQPAEFVIGNVGAETGWWCKSGCAASAP